MSRTEASLSPRSGTEMLFFDLAEIETLHHVALAVCAAEKHAQNPILPLGDKDAWDSAQAAPWALRTVLYDDEERVFKCWYNGHDHDMRGPWYGGYAVSADGVAWEKPALGLVEYNGTTRNNIVSDCPYGCVIKDASEPDPAKRYKMRVTRSVRYSADGRRWGEWVKLNVPEIEPFPHDAVVFLRDEQEPDPARRYKFVYQYYDQATKPGPDVARNKALVFGADETGWTPGAVKPMLSPNDGFEHENHFVMLIPYKGQYVMLYECGWYQPDGTGKFGRYMADIRLAHSRDGEHFTRILPDQPVIAVGAPGAWDEQFLVISEKAVVRDGLIRLYYCGQGSDWTSWPPGNQVAGDRTVDPERRGKGATGKIGLSRMGLATLRADGFTCLRVSDGVSFGAATTKPLDLRAGGVRGLSVNLSGGRAHGSWLQVEVLDADGAPLSGFAKDDCPPLFADSPSRPVRWRGGELSDLPTGPVRLRFHLFGRAKLHAVRFD